MGLHMLYSTLLNNRRWFCFPYVLFYCYFFMLRNIFQLRSNYFSITYLNIALLKNGICTLLNAFCLFSHSAVTLIISPSLYYKIILNASTYALLIDHVHQISVFFYASVISILYHSY